MSTEVATLVATLEADIRDLDRDFRAVEKRLDSLDRNTKKSSKAWENFGGVVKRVAQFAIAGFGLHALQSFVKGSITAATDLTESINAVEVVFGSASESVLAFAADTSDAVFVAEAELNQLVTLTGSLLQTFGFSAQEAAEQSIMLAERAADMASVFNTDVSDALLAVNSALRGETEPITRYGAKVNEAAIKAYLLSEGIVESTAALTDQQKTLARVALIMEQTSATQGDAANTADELANRQRHLTEMWVKAQAALGTQLIPVMEGAVAIGLNFAKGIEVIATIMSGWSDESKKLAAILSGVLLVALAAVFAHPVIAGLALVAAGIVAIGAGARRHEEAVHNFVEDITRLGGLSTASLMGAIPENELQNLTRLGISIEDIKTKLAEGEPSFKSFIKSVKAWAEESGLSKKEVLELNRSLHELMNQYFDATDEVRASQDGLSNWVQEAHSAATTSGELADKQRKVATETDSATTAFKIQRQEIGRISTPMSKLKDAVDAVRAAEERLIEVQNDEEATVQDIMDAQFDWIIQNENLIAVQRNLGNSVDKVKDQFFAMGLAFGISEDDLRSLWEAYNGFALSGDITKKINFISSITGQIPDVINVTPDGNNYYFHEGGIVPGPPGADVPAVLQAGEIVINPNKPGGGRNAPSVTPDMGGGGGTTVIQLIVDDKVAKDIVVMGTRAANRTGALL